MRQTDRDSAERQNARSGGNIAGSLTGGAVVAVLFMGSTLSGIDATGASFFQALCRKADFRDADLRNAVLVQAEMTEALLDGARLAGARRDAPVGIA